MKSVEQKLSNVLSLYKTANKKAPPPLIESGAGQGTSGANKTIATRKAVRGKSTVSQGGMDNLQGKKKKAK